jgi:hypothetical protein
MPAPAPITLMLATNMQQRRWQVFTAALLIILAGVVGYLIHGIGGTVGADKALPTTMPLPAHATLTRAEHFVTDKTYNWYYTIPQMDNDAISAYYQAQLPRYGWHCITAMKSLNSTIYGLQFTASSIYITALNGGTKLQLYTAGDDYGAYLLQDDVPDGAVALKISLEPAKANACPGAAGG